MPQTTKLHELFEKQVELYPHRTAVRHDDKTISYSELNRKANQLASYIRAHCSCALTNYIPIFLDKSIDCIVSIFAVLKAGYSYIPIHPKATSLMISTILNHCDASFVITKQEWKVQCIDYNGQFFCFDDESCCLLGYSDVNKNILSTNDVAYVIYTSGTTGLPKGVKVSHDNLFHTYTSWARTYNLSAQDIHLQMANPAFDVFVGDYARALLSGAELVLCPESVLVHPKALYQLIVDRGITCAEFIPAVLRPLLNYLEKNKQTLSSCRLILCGSDIWTMGEYRKTKLLAGPNTRVINSYGLTEATIDSTYYEESHRILSDSDLVPIGEAFEHVQIHILDEQLNEVRDEIGELYIGGLGVALGYLKQDELTSERFIQHPITHQRLYKTGDYAKKSSSGLVEFLGRNQSHVKINGNRVELLAVERLLIQHPKVEFAIVYCDTTSEVKLGCLLVLLDDTLTFDELHTFLKSQLPAFAVPRQMIIIEEVVVNQNGKVERALPLQKIIKELKPERVAPKNQLEEELCLHFKNRLGVDDMGVLCSFDDLGGNSLNWANLIETINRTYQLSLDCLAPNTVRGLAEHIELEYSL